jgi:nitrogen fixation NifU-like protein
MAYSDKVVDHYENPRNVGSFAKSEDSIGTGMVGAPACGDVMKLQIKVNPETGVIEDAKFKTYGCGSAIASSSLVTEWVKGKSLDEAQDQEHAHRDRARAAAGEDPLLDPRRGRDQGCGQRLQVEAPRRRARRRRGRRLRCPSPSPKPRRGTSPATSASEAGASACVWA